MEHSISKSTLSKFHLADKMGKLLLLAFLLLTSLISAQQADLRPYVTEGQDCTSNDVQLISARLSGEACTTCSPGDVLLVDLLITVRHNTNSDRPALAVFGDLTTTLPDGSSTTSNFIECSGPIIPKGKILNGTPVASGGNGIQTINYGQVSYVCGSQLEVNNILVAWTVPSDSDCPIVDANPHPKCGFQEGSLIIIPPLQATAEAFCTPENSIDLDAVGGSAPYSYEWAGPNGFTSTAEDLYEVAPGNYEVTITDSEGCSVSTSVTQIICCEFFATSNLDSSEQTIEGCDVSDLPTPFTSPENVFTNITENPCGNLIMLQSDISNGDLCSGGLLVNRSYTLFDDLNNNNVLDTGEEFTITDQNFRIIDATLPTFNAPLPEDTTAAYNNVLSPATLTASDNCDANPQVIMNETYIGDNGSTTYTIVRTWTASDCAGNAIEHTQNIFVTENGDPIGLAINDVSVNESAGTATFTVALTGITSTNFTVNFASANDSAVALDDFDYTSGTLPFNGTHGETQTVIVIINDDNIVESTENYTIELSGLTTAEIGINDASGLGTILDNDAATVSISDLDVNENAGVINVQVVLSGNVEESFTVDFETADGSALAGSDYNYAIGQVTFPNNATNGNIQNIAITINDDNLIEATENFLVDLSNISAIGDVTIADNQANVNILDDDTNVGDGISFEALDVEVTEGLGVTAIFNVVLTGAVQDAFDVSFETAFDTATATDFDAQNGILSFNGTDGEQQTITVTILNDEIIEPTEAYTVNLTGTTNVLVPINTPQANGSILDDDTNVGDGISFEALDVEVTEGLGVTAIFNVVLTGAVQDAFDVSFETAFDTATATDFDAQNGILSFNGTDGEQQTITVTILNDEIIEPTEAYTVNLTGTTNVLVPINTPQANGSILDDDTNVGDGISFEALDVEVTEGLGVTAIFNVVLTGAVQDAFDVSFETAFDTATATDFDAQNGILSFNGTDGEQQTITVTILNDEIIEPTEAYTVNLTGTTNVLVPINTPQANGSILDDDTNVGDGISFEALDVEVTEGLGVTAIFNVVLTGAVQDAFDVSFETAFDTATATDFDAQNGILSFNGTDGEQQTITVTILNDEIIEPTEAYTVNLTGTTNVLVPINTPQANGSILDDDTNVGDGISFEALDVEVTEGLGVTAIFNVVLTGAVQDAFDVSFETAFDTATATDFDAQNGILSFNGTDGEQQTITVTILNDEIIEPTEAYTVNLTGTTNVLVPINTPQANGSILDDDTNVGDGISFEALDVEVTEGLGVTAIFNVVLTGAVQDAFDVSFETAFDTATATDFDAQNGILSFNGTDGEQQTITVTILNDEIIEPTEAYTVNLTGTTNVLVPINTPQANGSILDDDTNVGDGISFEALDVEVTEGLGVTAIFNVVLTGAVQDAFDVSFETAFDTATATDFDAQNGILSFNGTDGEQQTITVTILNDEIIEPTEAYTVNLTGTTNVLVPINTPQANGSILDDDTNVGDGISFEALDVEVTEGLGVTAIFNVVLTGAVQDAFDVSFETAFDTATATDFDAQNGILSFNGTDGEQQTITVTILNDEIIEPTEAYTVNLTGTTNVLVPINTPQANGSILDDDTNVGDGISFEALDVEVTEGLGVTAIFNVVLTGAVQDAFDVSFETAFDTATATDFDAQNGILSFNGTDGEQQTITVTILNDEIIEPTEAYTVNLTGTTNVLVPINTPQANGSILDDDTNVGDGISFEALDVEVTEGLGVTAIFNVVLTGAVQDAFDVSFETAFDTATATDFDAQNGILSFNGTDGEQQTITVTILNDEIIEPTEAYTVNLTGTTNVLVPINTPQANGSILDDDTNVGDGISFEALDVEVTEGLGVTAIFNVVLTGAVQDAFDVSFETAFDTATATDFDAQNGILSFNGTDGEQQTITVTILNDEIIEPTEAYTVNLTGTTNVLVPINTPQANGSILDDDTNVGDGISFEALDVEVTEGLGVTAIFNVVLTGAVQDAFDVSFETAFDTATATDFDAQNGILSFNGTDGEQQTITVTILNDEIIEPTEAYTVNLTGTTNVLVPINTPQANGSILDDDTNVGDGISFEALDVEVTEGLGVTAIFNVVLTGAVQDAFDVSFETAFDTATATDFDAQNGILSFNGTDGEQQTITVTILNDEIIEPTEAYTVNLTGTTNVLVPINTPQANGSILDDDTNVGDGISFEALDVEVTEGLGVTAIFNVVLTGAVQDAFDVSFETAFDTATATDFDAQNGILSFNGTDGEQQTITVTILNDEIIEPTEAYTVNLTGTTNVLVPINTPQANGSILDDDAIAGTGIAFTDTDVIVIEGTDAFAIFNVTLTGNIAENVTVDYTTNEGTALNPGDFVNTTNTLTFTPTINSLDIQVPITDDAVIEPTEAFTVVLSNIVSNIGIGFVDGNTTNTANGTIYDDDSDPSLGVQFDVTSVDVNEDAGTVTLDVVLNADVQDEFTVEFFTTDGTAISPDDYTAIPEDTQRLIFGGANSNTQTITIDIIDDIIIESTENFQVILTDIATLDLQAPLVNILGNDTATVNIIDNDSDPSLGVQFDVISVDVNEDAGTVTLDVVLNVDVQDEFTVEFYTTDGTAISPDDFTAIPQDTQTLTFGAANSNTQTITIDIIDDIIIESTENFQVILTDISTPLVNILANDTATVNIIDNDSDPSLGVQFDVISVDVNEDAGTVTLDVVLNVDVQDEFTVEFYTTDGTAISPDDYTAIPQDTQTLTFGAANSNTQTITIDIIDDIIIESTENFQVILTDISTPLVNILANDTATVNIIDNDSDPSLGVQFDVTNVDVNEDAGTVTLDVVLNVDVQDEFTVEFYTTDGTAISPDDFTAIPQDTQTLTFGAANSNTQTITIDIIDDIIIESTENFQVILTDISTPLVNILTNDTATVNIIDNDGNEGYPQDITIEACDTIPDAAEITTDSTCTITVDLEETIEGQDDSCPTEYTITRTWTITDCVNNIRVHTQVITIEDTIAPVFVEALPQDMTVTCDEVPEAAILTALDNCDSNVTVTFEETVTNDANCSMGYMITRVWMASDCAGNNVSHTQVINVPATGPITASAYDEDITIMCGEAIPEVPNLEFMGGCGDYNVVFNEETQFSEESDDYMIVRTWNVTDACGNMATFEQLIFVMQPEKEYVSIDICVEDMTIDLTSYLPEDFDTNGVFTTTSGNVILNGNFFDPIDHIVGDYAIAYTSLDGTCKYYVDFEIKVNADCVPCGRKDIIASKTVTPNGDGMNDYFEIKGVENCDFRFDVMLFNRWGSKVYEAVEYQNDWGGSSPNNSFGNSGVLPAGTYYYIIKVTNRDFEPINGYIYLGTK